MTEVREEVDHHRLAVGLRLHARRGQAASSWRRQRLSVVRDERLVPQGLCLTLACRFSSGKQAIKIPTEIKHQSVQHPSPITIHREKFHPPVETV